MNVLNNVQGRVKVGNVRMEGGGRDESGSGKRICHKVGRGICECAQTVGYDGVYDLEWGTEKVSSYMRGPKMKLSESTKKKVFGENSWGKKWRTRIRDGRLEGITGSAKYWWIGVIGANSALKQL